MKYLWLSLISLLCLGSASPYNITGLWTEDWQNRCWIYCAPISINITPIDNSTSLNVTYNILSTTVSQYCSQYDVNGTFSSTLTPTNDTAWTDPFGGVLTYDPVNAIISYPFVKGNTTALLFTTGNSPIDQDYAFGSITGAWLNPTPIDPSVNNSECCVPDNILLYFTGPTFLSGQLTAVYNYSSSSCGDPDTNYNFNILSPNPVTLSWTVFVVDSPAANEIYFTPSNSSTQLSLILNPQNNSCGYYYEKLVPTLIVANNWQGDWQTASNTNMPSLYSVAIMNQSIMATSIKTNVGQLLSNYLIQTINGLYLDSFISFSGITTFSYNNQTNTFLNITNSTKPTANMLLSPTGDLFSPTPFIGVWSNPESTNNSPLPSDCCVPSYVNITNGTGYNLSVTYGYNRNSTNQGCQDIAQYQDSEGSIITDLYIKVPHITQLFWLDGYGNQVAFVNATSTSQITVSNFFGQCSFNVAQGNPIPPGPLSASWISHQVVYLVMVVLIVMN